jgi:hypothetical protein
METENESVETIPGMGGGRIKESDGGVNSTKIHCKNFGKCHNGSQCNNDVFNTSIIRSLCYLVCLVTLCLLFFNFTQAVESIITLHCCHFNL